MGDLSMHFSRSEFSCKCGYGCGKNTVDARLLEILEEIRTDMNKTITITSAHRCPRHNKEVDGSLHSQHLEGRAADIIIDDMAAVDTQQYIMDNYPELSVGRYNHFTHVDTRVVPAFWDKR